MGRIKILTSTLNGYIDDLNPLCCESCLDAAVILVGGKNFDLSDFPNLRGIFKTGVGTDNLPFAVAKVRGIKIAIPGEVACKIIYEESADFACNLIFRCLFRDIGNWNSWSKTARKSLRSKTVLVIGTGNIGGIVRDKMKTFCRVITFDLLNNRPEELRPLIEEADCVSIHVPLLDSTRDLMNSERLSWMKEGAALVNTARGPIVNEDAIYCELKAKRIYAALDVFWQEPYKGKLTELSENEVLLTPHTAGTCAEFLEHTAQDFREFVRSIGEICP